MDAAQALADLTEISSQIEAAVVLDADGATLASTLDGGAGRELRAGACRSCSRPSARAGTASGELGAGRGRDRRRQRLPRPGRRADDRRDHRPGADRRARLLRPQELPARLRRRAEAEAEAARRGRRRRRRGRCRGVRCVDRARCSPLGSLAGAIALPPPLRAARRERVDVYFEDGSMVSLADGSPEAATVLPLARRILETARVVVDDAALLAAIREHAYLEGDFVLRSGKRSTYYLDKYRFETVPELLEAARRAARRQRSPSVEPGRAAARRPRARRGRARRRRLARLAACRS